MPLSEHEQRILDEIERRLAAEDPKFARATAIAAPKGLALRRIKRAVACFVVGLGLLLAGLVTNLLIVFGLAGFAVMLASVVVVTKAMKDLGRVAKPRDEGSSWLNKAEDRWRKRFERGDER
jgi:uncharacterized membrane protein YdfJ with MMPL/SSD domain